MTTALLWTNHLTDGRVFGSFSYQVKAWYGFYIGALFSGVAGVGFYPLLGNRVWCRFGCPQAAILGLFQRYVSRFRITTNGGQCMSCGNCSTYCEMGIDVRAYAQKGENIDPRLVCRLRRLLGGLPARRAEARERRADR